MLDEKASLEERLTECTEDDACELSRIEINFGIPVQMTQEMQRKLIDWVNKVVSEPFNQPVNGVHWLSGIGAKMVFSDIDMHMMGERPHVGPDKPADGEEPVADESVYALDCAARPFVTEKEKARVQAERAEVKP